MELWDAGAGPETQVSEARSFGERTGWQGDSITIGQLINSVSVSGTLKVNMKLNLGHCLNTSAEFHGDVHMPANDFLGTNPLRW
jgi:hypothetical protein